MSAIEQVGIFSLKKLDILYCHTRAHQKSFFRFNAEKKIFNVIFSSFAQIPSGRSRDCHAVKQDYPRS